MKTFTITALTTLLAALTTAAPTAEPRQFQAQITFEGAAGASFTLSVPTDGSLFSISMSSPPTAFSNFNELC